MKHSTAAVALTTVSVPSFFIKPYFNHKEDLCKYIKPMHYTSQRKHRHLIINVIHIKHCIYFSVTHRFKY